MESSILRRHAAAGGRESDLSVIFGFKVGDDVRWRVSVAGAGDDARGNSSSMLAHCTGDDEGALNVSVASSTSPPCRNEFS